MSNTAAPSFRRGTQAMEEAFEQASASFAKDHFFKLEDKESCILRFLTEADYDPNIEGSGFITVLQYGNVPTKPAPKGYTGNWPSSMPAVARSDEAFTGMFADDYIAEFVRDSKGNPLRPSPRYWAYACLREEVFGDGSDDLGGPAMKGKVIGYRDKTREVVIKRDDKEETVVEKAVILVNMAYKNFYSQLIGFARQYGTMLDRDYHITRQGSGANDTTYRIVPLDPIPGLDLRDPEVMKRYPVAKPLGDVIAERASDEYYARFFDRRVEVVDDDGAQGAPASEQVRPATDVQDDERLAALRSRVTGYEQPAAAATEASAEAPAEQDAPAAEPPAVPAAAGVPRNFD